ncbi:MAG: hypothetical protein UY48_C0003G0052 [Candidatus Gottesmanbacteria bacterium GW2011_GWB1_49_7]|uniref:Uncharacterized protein n=1 Tax=Candidatus Gottesmanbacteria bacterium GW2011_GWB1_49_7 TaxID=1618448 RepID=A0A0G1W3T6_9BACT|nr:MAG: hypothetical protein UY48_C0003G0052 [Candidatus Gottesmanbacteria bacterium GW2011_GWB1_49_7]
MKKSNTNQDCPSILRRVKFAKANDKMFACKLSRGEVRWFPTAKLARTAARQEITRRWKEESIGSSAWAEDSKGNHYEYALKLGPRGGTTITRTKKSGALR